MNVIRGERLASGRGFGTGLFISRVNRSLRRSLRSA
jgi:hypothetical protein